MDNHPIPQDVTNFQFKLVGDLTLKQFGYLIASVIVAWLFFLLPLFTIIKLPLSVASLGIGIILAFVPLEGRPSDLMFLHFFKALFSPNQYSFQNATAAQQTIIQEPEKKEEEKKVEEKPEKMYFSSPVPVQAPTPATTEEPEHAAIVNPIQAPVVEDQQAPVVPTTPTPPPQQQVVQENSIAQKEQVLEKELQEAKEAESHQQAGSQEATMAHQKVEELEHQLRDVFSQKQDLEQQILLLRQQLAQKQQQKVFTPSDAPQPPQQTSHVIKIPKQLGKSVGLPIAPDVPNLLSGIVKDPRGNVLPNMLIEVKDKDGNAVRAFKTNTLGQFASATPLLNGTYTVTFEDPNGKQSFDAVEITADGEILSPIEVISVDQREMLRQELFGAGTPVVST